MGGKELIACGKENVVISAGECEVTVLPQFGGKIASIRLKGRELLQQPLAPIAPRTPTMGFDESDASGWDECLPSVAACRVQTVDGAISEIGDHGSMWRVSWLELKRQENPQSISLGANCLWLTLMLERTLTLAQTKRGWRLSVQYSINNTGAAPMPWSWAAHPLFAVQAGDRIMLPDSIDALRLEGSGGGRLGKNGDTVSWPMAKLAAGGEADLSVALPADSGVGDKLFAGPLAEGDGWSELVRPSAGMKIRVSFDTAAAPYLGLWICYGGWPDGDRPRQVCVAMEPSTAPVDSLAETGPWSRELAPGEWFNWTMNVDLETL